jgi:hypothetical protein
MNNRRTLLALVVIFGVLVIIATLQGNPPAPGLQSSPLPSPTAAIPQGTLLRVFPDITVLDIQAIRILNPVTGQTFTIQRGQAGQWYAPGIEGELDSSAASGIARTIVLLPYGRSINILATTNLDDYGFGETGQYLIQIILSNGEGHGIIIGAADASDPVYYALVDERDEIFRIERGPVDYLIQFLNSPPINLTN